MQTQLIASQIGNRNAFALDLKDIYNYFGKVCITSNELMKLQTNQTSAVSKSWWLSSACVTNSILAWRILGDHGNLSTSLASATYAVRPAFNLDLSKINFTKV